MRNTWRLALAGAALLAAVAPAAAHSSPVDIVQSIYARVATFCDGHAVDPPYSDKLMRATFEKPVADSYLARQRKTQIDFDIFVDAQDCKLANLAIEQIEAPAGTAIVRVRFDNFGQARSIDFQLRSAGPVWMISDMTYRHRKFTLRAFLGLKP